MYTFSERPRYDQDGNRWAVGCGPDALEPLGPVVVGVDIGQRSDYSCICVAEAERDPSNLERWRFSIRLLERIELGTVYPKVADRIVQVCQRIEGRDLPTIHAARRDGFHLAKRDSVCMVDVTGVGRGVLDILRERMGTLDTKVVPATFTHGEKISTNGRGSKAEIVVGKSALVSRLTALIQTKRIVAPGSLPLLAVLEKELLDFEIRVSPNGNDTYGAFRVGQHDDAVTAVGLSCLLDPADRNRGANVVAY